MINRCNRIKNFKKKNSLQVTIYTYKIIQLNIHILKLLQVVPYYTLIKNIHYKIRPGLTIYQVKKLESIFIEIILPKKSNIIVGSIYKRLSMNICTFNDHYVNLLLENLSKEQNKKIILIWDFNINLLRFNSLQYINEFIDNITSSSLQLQILQPTRIHKNPKTLVDNIFCNIPNFKIKNAVSGNITTTLSDFFQQFFLIPDLFSHSPPPKYNIMNHDWKNFNGQEFLEDFKKTQ